MSCQIWENFQALFLGVLFQPYPVFSFLDSDRHKCWTFFFILAPQVPEVLLIFFFQFIFSLFRFGNFCCSDSLILLFVFSFLLWSTFSEFFFFSCFSVVKVPFGYFLSSNSAEAFEFLVCTKHVVIAAFSWLL